MLIDDAGFGNPSTFSGPIDTPNDTRRAKGGLRYNRFHITALCLGTRPAFLTGRNNHAVGFGSVGELSMGLPGPPRSSSEKTAQHSPGSSRTTATAPQPSASAPDPLSPHAAHLPQAFHPLGMRSLGSPRCEVPWPAATIGRPGREPRRRDGRGTRHRAVETEQLTATLGAPVIPMLCVHDTQLPWGELYVNGIPVLTLGRLVATLRALPSHIDEVGVMLVTEEAWHKLRPAA